MNVIERTKSRILNILSQTKRPLNEKQLIKKVRGTKNAAKPTEVYAALSELVNEGRIRRVDDTWQIGNGGEGEYIAEVVRLNKTFGFVRRADDKAVQNEIFVPGKFMLGAMPGDLVLCKPIRSKGELEEAQITEVLKYSEASFSGILVEEYGQYYVKPDTLCKDLLRIEGDVDAKAGDKIICTISERGSRHSEHLCTIAATFGTADNAENCARTTLYINEVETEFPSAVMDEARYVANQKITDKDIYSRVDLREEVIFTIDGADTKDIDDAISVEKTETGYKLGVHIADVSHYVKPGSALDNDAFVRGTSIYYADKVIPMLPKELSNGICSLNPKEDRLAFSCLMELNNEGETDSFKFQKTVIRSRVKGVYTEVNRIIEAGNIPDDLSEKYGGLLETILTAKELSEKLKARRRKRGAPDISSPEAKLEIDENGICIGAKRRESGPAEEMIEDFMLCANSCAAKVGRENNIPFVYRVHEPPSPEKTQRYLDVLSKLNIPHKEIDKLKAAHISAILEQVRDSQYFTLINYLSLRTMAKAKYSEEPIGHFGLVLKDYAHFTSPIRRYPDLAIHRILTDFCYNKQSPAQVTKRYGAFAVSAAAASSEAELLALKVERQCDAIYLAEYMSHHIGEEFPAVITSVTEYGMYAELENTAEGLIKIEDITPHCDFDGDFSMISGGKPLYTVGQTIKVKCVRSEISSGNIDFEIV